MPCSANFLKTLQTEILSTETSDFLKQIIFLKSFNSVFNVNRYIAKIFQSFLEKETTIGLPVCLPGQCLPSIMGSSIMGCTPKGKICYLESKFIYFRFDPH